MSDVIDKKSSESVIVQQQDPVQTEGQGGATQGQGRGTKQGRTGCSLCKCATLTIIDILP